MAKEHSNTAETKRPDKFILSRTLILMIVCGIVAFVVLAVQLYKIQIVEHDRYEGMAVEQQVRETTVTSTRGSIYDSNMKILAMSANVETVYISPVEMKNNKEDKEFIARNLSEILGVEYETIMEKWKDEKSWYKTVAVKIESELADKVRAFKNENELTSVHLITDTKRYYPYGSLAAQIIGFTGTENYGLEGLEAYYDDELQGTNGRIVRTTTSAGTELLFTGYEDYVEAKDGNSLVLTIDATAQYYLEKNLEQAIADYSIQSGAIGIVMEVDTGGILAMASMPNYDLNDRNAVSQQVQEKIAELPEEERSEALTAARLAQWRNRAVMDTYEPGSTFKIVTLASAMEAGIVNESSTFDCQGAIKVLGRDDDDPAHCWKRAGHGVQTLAEAAQHSCNVAFITIGLRMGAATFYDYVKAFGLFDSTGIDMSGEGESIWWSESVFEDPQNYSQLAAASFGQTFNITPLQLITAVSAVANGGYLMEPYVVQTILDGNGDVVEEHEPTVVRQVISEETSQRVCAILESVVGTKEGTGKNAYVAGYRIAGKTGTSEKVGQQSDDYIVSFIGFAPADDPKIAVLVLLDTPATGGLGISGGVMAAPTVGNIFADLLPYLNVKAEYTSEELARLDIIVPNEIGKNVNAAAVELAGKGFVVKVVGSGTDVTDQMPIANVSVATGTEVVLYAGDARPDTKSVVPSLMGLSYTRARELLTEAGLYIRTSGVTPSASSTIVVSQQSVAPETEVVYGSVVEVTLIDSDRSIMEGRA